MTILDEPARRFQVWGYTVGMGRLLLRSTKGEGCRTRIDVLFQNVKAVNLKTSLRGVTVWEADSEQERRIVKATGLLRDENTRFFVVVDAMHEGYVVAGVCAQCRDGGEYYEPSELWPTGSTGS